MLRAIHLSQPDRFSRLCVFPTALAAAEIRAAPTDEGYHQPYFGAVVHRHGRFHCGLHQVRCFVHSRVSTSGLVVELVVCGIFGRGTKVFVVDGVCRRLSHRC